MAPVGQALIQSEQVPQRSEPGTSGGSASVVRISPNNNQEPCSEDTRLECFPIQPRPARCAQAFSIIGPVSTYDFVSTPGPTPGFSSPEVPTDLQIRDGSPLPRRSGRCGR